MVTRICYEFNLYK